MKTKLLVIEDNEQHMYLMTYLFANTEFEVHQAFNGNDGISLAGKILPDAILLDIELPEMDGYTVARELKKDPELNHIPIIIVTSYAMDGDREKSYEAGVTGYIEKPINTDTFINQVENFLKFEK